MENLHKPTLLPSNNKTYPMYLAFHGVSILSCSLNIQVQHSYEAPGWLLDSVTQYVIL